MIHFDILEEIAHDPTNNHYWLFQEIKERWEEDDIDIANLGGRYYGGEIADILNGIRKNAKQIP